MNSNWSRGYWYAVVRIDGKQVSVHETRHEAVGLIARCHAGKREWYEVEVINPASYLWWEPRMTASFEKRDGDY